MTYEEVIKQEPLKKINYWSWDVLKTTTIACSIIAVVLIICMVIMPISSAGLIMKILIGFSIWIVLALFYVMSTHEYKELKQESYLNWRENYVIPYIKSLETHKEKKLNNIEIVFDGDLPRGIVRFVYEGKFHSKNAFLDFKENVSEPFITYKINDTDFDIPLNVYPERYNKNEPYYVTLHLPSDYQF